MWGNVSVFPASLEGGGMKKRMMETVGFLCTGQEQFKLKLSSHLCSSVSSPIPLHALSHHRTSSFLSEAQHKGVNLNLYPKREWLHPSIAQLKAISLCTLAVFSPISPKPAWLFSCWVIFSILQLLRVVGAGWTRVEPTNQHERNSSETFQIEKHTQHFLYKRF